MANWVHPNTDRGSSIRWMFLCAVALCGMAACVPDYEAIRGRDNQVSFPLVRGSIDLVPRRANGLWVAAELEASRGSGTSSQTIDAGRSTALGGQLFTGPAQISSEFSLSTQSVVLRGGTWLNPSIAFEALGGVGSEIVTIDLRSGGVSISDREFNLGLLAGAQLSGSPTPWLTLSGRLTGIIGLESDLETIELGAHIQVVRHLAVVGGWRKWTYREEVRSGRGPVDLSLSGPMAGIVLSF